MFVAPLNSLKKYVSTCTIELKDKISLAYEMTKLGHRIFFPSFLFVPYKKTSVENNLKSIFVQLFNFRHFSHTFKHNHLRLLTTI